MAKQNQVTDNNPKLMKLRLLRITVPLWLLISGADPSMSYQF